MTINRTDDARRAVHREVQDDLRVLRPDIRLAEIDPHACDVASSWANRRVDWSWRRITRLKREERYDLAIWSDSSLCGLAWGASRDAWISINWLESSPDPASPLRGRITPIAIAVLERQALSSGRFQARIVGPLPGVVHLYERHGYRPVLAKPGLIGYMVKRLR